MALVALLLAFYAWGGAHSQDWDCHGPIPAYGARCTPSVVPGVPDERL